MRSTIFTKRNAAGIFLLGLLGLCACSPKPDDAVLCSAYKDEASHVEVIVDGSIARILGTQEGRSGEHEGFLLRLASGCALTVRVETNVSITGSIPLRGGERVTVKGEYEYYPEGGVVHWTHRAFGSHHASGYVEAGDRLYW